MPAHPGARTGIQRLSGGAVALAVLLGVPGHARASQAEAREAALSAGCRPDKITVVRQIVGAEPETTYQMTCQEGKGLSVLVRCQGHTCIVLR